MSARANISRRVVYSDFQFINSTFCVVQLVQRVYLFCGRMSPASKNTFQEQIYYNRSKFTDLLLTNTRCDHNNNHHLVGVIPNQSRNVRLKLLHITHHCLVNLVSPPIPSSTHPQRKTICHCNARMSTN